jgi:hypothetical protein
MVRPDGGSERWAPPDNFPWQNARICHSPSKNVRSPRSDPSTKFNLSIVEGLRTGIFPPYRNGDFDSSRGFARTGELDLCDRDRVET